jgi:hypothetical protein
MRGCTALVLAAHHGHFEIVKYLAGECRANVNAARKDGCTVQLAEKCRCALWGVSASPLYLQQTVSVGVLKCVGQVQGYVNDKSSTRNPQAKTLASSHS